MKLRKAWIKAFNYEIDSELVSACMVISLKEEIDTKEESFQNYEEGKERIILNIKIGSKEIKRKKMIKDLEEKLGKEGKGKEPLQLTQGLGEDERKIVVMRKRKKKKKKKEIRVKP